MILCVVFFGNCDEVKNYNVTFGYMGSLFNNITKKDAKIATEIWLNEVVSRSKELESAKIKTIIYNDLPSLIAAAKTKQVDFVGITSQDYIHLKDKTSLEPALAYTVGGKPGSIFYLVVSKDMESTSVKGLRNKSVLIQKTDESGQIPLFWLNSLLRKQGLPSASGFLRSIKMVETPSQAILPVFFQQADCCIVTLEGFETSQELILLRQLNIQLNIFIKHFAS
jgi:hypothetical protein